MNNKKQKDLPYMHEVVLSVLPAGRSNAITFKEIMSRVGARSNEERQIRSILSELPTIYKRPVASSSEKKYKGFFLVVDLEDFLVGDRSLVTRELHTHKRRNSYREACAHLFTPGTGENRDE
ncbi:hypothetical protein RW25_11270 [Bacillus sp. L_1B0_8]|uniref:hypothetical protein n=1 Tax=unclassified Bacillus (in: firmicutes) TaxID=185979 RepID=UPI0005B6D9CD|nr:MULTISPECIES: hypothetical protein [unclassified Bacillus (in: firmicutes)]KIQ89482.1 hypothetical protein RT27_07115 [Bacillus sp. L_1B0_5]KIQ89489.1 hypothetical protein RW25_11270 [Bacillus sp. L_1B0_8]